MTLNKIMSLYLKFQSISKVAIISPGFFKTSRTLPSFKIIAGLKGLPRSSPSCFLQLELFTEMLS